MLVRQIAKDWKIGGLPAGIPGLKVASDDIEVTSSRRFRPILVLLGLALNPCAFVVALGLLPFDAKRTVSIPKKPHLYLPAWITVPELGTLSGLAPLLNSKRNAEETMHAELTKKAEADKNWGWLPTLRQILESKHIPDFYFGASSVLDNIFRQVRRLLEIEILIRENRSEISEALQGASGNKLAEDLLRVRDALGHTAKQFAEAQHHLDRILSSHR